MALTIPYLVFETTPRCGLNCRYCYNYYKKSGGRAPGSPSYTACMKTLRSLYSLATVDTIIMSGGEPFLAERFAELVLFCRMKKSRVKILTSGSAACFDDYRQLMAMGNVSFQFPLHSAAPSIHDDLTRVPGSWEKSVRSIRELISLGGMPFVVMVLTALNHQGIDDLLDFIAALGVRHLLILRYNIGGEGITDIRNLMPSKAALRNAFAQADRFAARSELTVSSNVCTPVCLLDPRDYPHLGFTYCSADPLKLPITLDHRGNIRRCNHSSRITGNIFSGGLEILLSGGNKDWEAVPALCAQCDKYEKCRGGCRAAAEQYYNDTSRADPCLEFC